MLQESMAMRSREGVKFPVATGLKISEEMRERVETWRAQLRPIPTVQEACRRLLDMALTADGLPPRETPADDP
jgi:hypothetical protein